MAVAQLDLDGHHRQGSNQHDMDQPANQPAAKVVEGLDELDEAMAELLAVMNAEHREAFDAMSAAEVLQMQNEEECEGCHQLLTDDEIAELVLSEDCPLRTAEVDEEQGLYVPAPISTSKALEACRLLMQYYERVPEGMHAEDVNLVLSNMSSVYDELRGCQDAARKQTSIASYFTAQDNNV